MDEQVLPLLVAQQKQIEQLIQKIDRMSGQLIALDAIAGVLVVTHPKQELIQAALAQESERWQTAALYSGISDAALLELLAVLRKATGGNESPPPAAQEPVRD